MSSLLPPLHNGHASIYLLNGFHEAVHAYEDWDMTDQEPQVAVYGKTVRISVIFRRLTQCSDKLPEHVLESLKAAIPHIMQHQPMDFPATYADASGLLRQALSNYVRRPVTGTIYN